MVVEKRRPACLPEHACYFVRPFRATVLFRIGNQQAADGLAWVTLAPHLTQRNIPPSPSRVTFAPPLPTSQPQTGEFSCARSSVTLPRATDPIPATASKQVVQQYQPPGEVSMLLAEHLAAPWHCSNPLKPIDNNYEGFSGAALCKFTRKVKHFTFKALAYLSL
ncbi:hypothetical protein VOLCADRAFT_104037, partial [Volvox carteri f. nagariensis]